MNKILKLMCALATLPMTDVALAQERTMHTSKPDSVYLMSYTTSHDNYHLGLHFAYSLDGENWMSIGNGRSYLKSDFGAWGSQKRMLTPWVTKGHDGWWHCVWSLGEAMPVFAHSSSPNLTDWYRQSYPDTKGNCQNPVLAAEGNKGVLTYTSEGKQYRMTTTDYKTWTSPVQVNVKKTEANTYRTVDLNNHLGEVSGNVQKVAWTVVDHLLKYHEHRIVKEQQNAEQVMIPALEGLKPVEAQLTLTSPVKAKAISDELIGVFFEDINYAADGGIYAELVQNRGFEYAPNDTRGRWGWNHNYAWSLKNATDGDKFEIATDDPIHENNKHYAALTISKPGVALVNEGFDGIVLKKGDKYDLSLWARQLEGKGGKLTVRLVDEGGNIVGEKKLSAPSEKKWTKVNAVIVANADADKAQLQVIPSTVGKVGLDMISLFPQKTFKGRKNGMRPDLAQILADMKPRFVRFPGGCASHGDGLHNIYRWVNTVGSLEARKPMRNIWNYHQSMGLGFYEYFQFCEDIGAEPLPVLAAGVPCQNSSDGGHGQQGGIPMDEMDEYVEEILNLIEWANGDPKKNKWAKMRADAGHPKPFNLKYLGIGNEDLITDVFEVRFKMIFDAVKEKYPEITVIGTVGPFYEGSDYEEGWDLATRYEVPIVDEHYYNSPGWFMNNQDYYDRYDRSKKTKVYLGEYATHIGGRATNLQTALCDALHLTNVERNGDVVVMTSYAPLLAKEGHTQWNPDLIYFNNKEVKPTVEYFVQKLFSLNSGNEYLASKLTGKEFGNQDIRKRISHSIVRDEETGDVIVKLVNLLPAEVNMDIDLSALGEQIGTAKRTILTGKDMNDRNARPVEDTIEVNGTRLQQTLPAYSLTIIRL